MTADPNRRPWWILALILVLGAGLRLAYLVEIRDAPDFTKPGRDALYHDYWARAMLSGDWAPPPGKVDPEIRTTPYMRPPGYPFFLAGAYAVTGGSYAGARAVQMFLGLINAVLAFWLGRRLFDVATGLTFAALMAFYWMFIYYEGELHAPVLAVTATLALLLACRHWSESPTLPRAFAAGAVLGLFVLVRPNVLVTAPFLLAWMLWVSRRRGEVRRFLVQAAMLVFGVAVTVGPVTLRNQLAAGDRVLVTTNAGINLYVSHNPEADGVTSVIPELRQLTGLAGWTCFEYPELVRGIGRELGRSPDEFRHSEASRYFFDRAVEWAWSHPRRTLTSAFERALLFWGPAEVSNDEVVHFDRASSPVLRTLPGGFAAVLALAVVGAVGSFRRLRDQLSFESWVLIAAFVAGYFASVLPTLAASRYRVPVIPCLLLFAAWGLVRWSRLWRRGESRQAVVAALICVGLYAVVSRPWVAYTPDEAAWHFNLAVADHRSGKLEEAIAGYRRALESDSDDPDAHSNLGSALLARGDTDTAAEHFRAALAASPDHADAHFNLGLALAADGRMREAAERFQRTLEIRPGDEAALRHLATARRGLAASHNQRGRELAQAGDLEGALVELTAAVELDPSSAPLENNLGNVLAILGRLPDAAVHFRRSLELDPDYLGAHRNLVRAYLALEHWSEAAAAAAAGIEAARRAGEEALAAELEQIRSQLTAGSRR